MYLMSLRTPLTVISGYMETLSDSQQLPEKWQKPLEQMQQQAIRMTTLINDLTSLSKLETDSTQQTPEVIALKTIAPYDLRFCQSNQRR